MTASIPHGRRRVLTLIAGTGAALAAGAVEWAAAGAPPPDAPPLARWRGAAMGARASLAIAHPEAPRLIAAARAEIDRLEDVFSLHRPDSALARLNRDGALDAPPAELVTLLALCARVHAATGGAFDPSVQPLWQALAEAGARGREADPAALAAARARIGFDAVEISSARIRFGRPGMALTLNGIAQGCVADRVAALLAAEGLADALVETGEVHALGRRPDGTPWRVGIVARKDDQGGDAPARRIGLSNRALAVSSPTGTLVDPTTGAGHILDPRTGVPVSARDLVAVSAPQAAVADALSTALCIIDDSAAAAAVAAFRGARVEAMA